MRRFWMVMVVLAGAVSAAIAAPSTAPSAVAKSSPATGSADRSTPKGALKAFARALDSGDRAGVIAALAVDSDQDRRLAGATADLAQASAALRQASIKEFGEDKSRALGVDPAAATAAAARIDAAGETIAGEAAVVRSADNEGPPMSLVKRGGQWLIPVGELSKDVDPADIDRNLADVTVQVTLMHTLADEVKAGKFASATDARQALDQRILRDTMPKLDAAARPASGPAGPASPQP